MFEDMDKVMDRPVTRRSFLRGSALFAAAMGLSVAAPALAQQQPPQQPEKPEEKPAEPAEGEKETKVDKDGREYRECPQCGSNMYKQGRTWTCENCGYSYVE